MALPCSRCRTTIPAQAKFCPGCGAPQGHPTASAAPQGHLTASAVPSASPAPSTSPAPSEAALLAGAPMRRVAPNTPTGPQVCPGCGVRRAAALRACDVCDASYEEPGVAPPEDDDCWVSVRCQFQCRSCGHLSPLDQLDMDGSVTCLRCGLDQVFDVESWDDGLHHAMRAGVLAGTGDLAQLGVQVSSVELVQSGITVADGMMTTRSLRVDAGPGHPLCGRCRVPLARDRESAAGETRVRCPACGGAQRCLLPAAAATMCPPVRGVLAEELGADGRDAKVDATAGAVAITCPRCAAPLKVTGASTIVTCEYCETSSRIPRRTLFHLGHDHPVPQVWWLLFSRTAARTLAAPAPKRAPIPAPRVRPAVPAAAQTRPSQGPGILAALGVLGIVGAVGYRERIAGWSARTEAAVTTALAPTPAKRPAPPAATRPTPPPSQFVALDRCRCGATQLEVQVEPRGDGTAVQLRANRGAAGVVPLNALESSARTLGIAIGCHGDTVALVLGDHAYGWSLTGRTQRWASPLGAAYRYTGAEPSSGLRLYCRSMNTSRGKLTVPTGARGTVTVDLATGVVTRPR